MRCDALSLVKGAVSVLFGVFVGMTSSRVTKLPKTVSHVYTDSVYLHVMSIIKDAQTYFNVLIAGFPPLYRFRKISSKPMSFQA